MKVYPFKIDTKDDVAESRSRVIQYMGEVTDIIDDIEEDLNTAYEIRQTPKVIDRLEMEHTAYTMKLEELEGIYEILERKLVTWSTPPQLHD